MRYERTQHAAAWTDDFVFAQLIPYIGNKRKLLGLIRRAIDVTGIRAGRFVDFFAGSGVVSRFAKHAGFEVIANDWEPYALSLNRCWIEQNAPPSFASLGGYGRAIQTLNALPGEVGWVTTHLCPDDDERPDALRDRMFYTRANGMRIDAMRSQISRWLDAGMIDDAELHCLLAPMLYAACYTANTSGVFKGFHNGWGGQTATALYRIRSRFALRSASFFDNSLANRATQMDATQLARSLRSDGSPIDIAYLDPPYNQHPYASNYHVLNSIALWDKPAVSPKITPRMKSAIREDWQTTRRSAYNYRGEAERAFTELLDAIDARFILVSYSTDGMIPLHAFMDSCLARGATSVLSEPYKRYRVSTQRFSKKPMNVEFVAVIDCSRCASNIGANELVEQIRVSEIDALSKHRETTCG
jgi:adenine-specific DNA-methyltransferase